MCTADCPMATNLTSTRGTCVPAVKAVCMCLWPPAAHNALCSDHAIVAVVRPQLWSTMLTLLCERTGSDQLHLAVVAKAFMRIGLSCGRLCSLWRHYVSAQGRTSYTWLWEPNRAALSSRHSRIACIFCCSDCCTLWVHCTAACLAAITHGRPACQPWESALLFSPG